MATLVIAGTASGVGKTTVTLGLITAIRRHGLTVQPFKVGPDYIDPSHHAQAAGRASRNLDSWMLSPGAVVELFERARGEADLALVEGVMGLFDGKSGGAEIGSTAHVAKIIGAPVVLVVDVGKAARSAAAVVLGFRRFDPDLQLAGVILNNVASPTHFQAVADPIEREAGVPVLGWLKRDPGWRAAERYLGLVPAQERWLDEADLGRLADSLVATVDLNRLVEIAATARVPDPATRRLFPETTVPRRARIAVARDEAFSFYYEDNLDLLRAWGAEIVPFSPLRDTQLPPSTAGLYIGGGFPELFAEKLAANTALLSRVRQAARAGLPIYAECGGLMYVSEGLTDQDGRPHRMAGVVPGWTTIGPARLTLGYREVRARSDSPLLKRGETVRGHEFHWSVPTAPPSTDDAAYDLLGRDGAIDGHTRENVLASYIHLHFGADPRLAPRFVEACAGWSARCHPERSEGSRSFTPATEILRCAQDDNGHEHGMRTRNDRGPKTLLQRVGLPPSEIEPLSLRRVVEQVGDRLPIAEPERSFVARLVYAAGDPELADRVTWSADAVNRGLDALGAGATVIADVRMVAAGVSRTLLARLGSKLVVALDADPGQEGGAAGATTRTASGIIALGGELDGAVVAIGNAPTALLALLDLVRSGYARPALVLGFPVGFVAASESKEHLVSAGVPYVTLPGTRGGSPLAVAAVNSLLRLASSSRGIERAAYGPTKTRG
jgi:cobyrinic acid a,c-diamide synthase